MLTNSELQRTIREQKQAVLVVNLHSRKSAGLFAEAKEALERHGIALQATHAIKDSKRVPDLIATAVKAGCRWLILGGGDGTVNSAIDALAYQDVVLGLLPLGTSNNFARSLGIPLSLESAVDLLTRGEVVNCNLGKVGGKYFANAASIGLTAAFTRDASHWLKRYLGRLAYGLAGIRKLVFHQPFACHFSARERNGTVRTHQVIIGNGRIHGGMLLAPNASIANRQLIFFTLGGPSRWQLIRTWSLAVFGRHTTTPEANFFSTIEVAIETDPVLPIDMDGHVTARTPARFTLAPDALKLIAPANFEQPPGA